MSKYIQLKKVKRKNVKTKMYMFGGGGQKKSTFYEGNTVGRVGGMQYPYICNVFCGHKPIIVI